MVVKRVVEVAFVVVLFKPVKFCRVLDPVAKILVNVPAAAVVPPMIELSMTPPEMVRLSATRLSASVPVQPSVSDVAPRSAVEGEPPRVRVTLVSSVLVKAAPPVIEEAAGVMVVQPKRPAVQDRPLVDPLHVPSPAPWMFAAKSFEEEAVVLKKFVVVAEEPVAFTKVKFWRVDDPVARKFVVVENVNKEERPVRRPVSFWKVKLVLPPKVVPPSLNWT